MIIVDNIEQGTREWRKLRLGIPTASNFSKIITSTGKASTQRKAYLNKLLAEWFTGKPADSYKNTAMERGNELEADARSLFAFIKVVKVKEVGLVYLDKRKLVAASPDGLYGYDVVKDVFLRGYEAKCPDAHTHIGYLLNQKLPSQYKAQVQGSMYVTGLDHWAFMSYHPEMKPLIINVDRDERYIKLLADELDCFVTEMLELRTRLEALK